MTSWRSSGRGWDLACLLTVIPIEFLPRKRALQRRILSNQIWGSLSLSLVLPSQAISSFPFLAFKQPWVFSFLGRNLFPVRTVSPFVLTDVASSGGGALGGFVSSPPTSFGCRRRQFCDASCMPLASVARLDCN